MLERGVFKEDKGERQRRAIYIAIYRLTTIIGLSGHIVVYMLYSRCKHLENYCCHLIHAVQAGKIIFGI